MGEKKRNKEKKHVRSQMIYLHTHKHFTTEFFIKCFVTSKQHTHTHTHQKERGNTQKKNKTIISNNDDNNNNQIIKNIFQYLVFQT